ncbi:MAG TPA: FAD-dependent oxidoreductase [Candidatus Limnocylindrales bacterium]|nr:FAD-dependent oxidoreductase [Candidatus Limnocylindrales bacterium]
MSTDNRDDSGTGRAGRRVSRREFLRLAGVAAAAAGATTLPGVRDARAEDAPKFDMEVDVVVVGSGAAGSVAAIFAHEAGAKVALVEKALLFGGTTSKSGGVYWIPNNRFLRERGVEGPREQTIAKMARFSYPTRFREGDAPFGLAQHEYDLLAALYDNGPTMVDELERLGALVSMPADKPFGAMPDYFDESVDDKEPIDRRMWSKKPDGSFGLGAEMVRQLKEAIDKRQIPVLMGHRVVAVLRNSHGEVVGVEAEKIDKSTIRIRASRGVIFGSGGFTQNPDLVEQFQPGPVFGGCAVPTNEGDFVYIAAAAGARLGNMSSAWRAQIVLEQALQFSSTPDDVFMPPGDSTILVNRLGRRVVNETANYNERTRIHFAWDPSRHEWINMLLFMIYDQRGAELYGGRFPIPAPGTQAPYVVTGANANELEVAINQRLAKLAPKIGHVQLEENFAGSLSTTVKRFNEFAARGADVDFHRGEKLYDRLWHSHVWSYPNPGTTHALGKTPNPTMHPLDPASRLYAIILASGTLDTNGGPMISALGEVLSTDGKPIPGLYGAGNCISSPTGHYYYGGGGTLGPAMTYAYLAAKSAAAAPVKELD